MLFSLFSNPISFVFYLAGLFIAITVHEFAHAWMADKLGDPTPRLDGRVTLNPKAHIDPWGLVVLLFFGFGWGRPVQYDPYNLKDPRRDSAYIALAGPVSNILLASLLSFLIYLFNLIDFSILSIISQIVFPPLIMLNLTLAIFNLLPVHPLDGFSIVEGFLPRDQAADWSQLRRYGIIFLLLLIIPIGSQSMVSMIMRPIMQFVVPLFIPSFGGGGVV